MAQEDLVRSRLSFKSYVYLFPVATWVAQSIELFKDSAGYFGIFLAFILFAFIPVEVYVSELWGRAASPSAKTRNIFIANVLDLTGVFSLSLFYIAYPSLLKARSSGAEWSKISLLLLGFGGLLVLNYIWNRLCEVRHRQVFNELRQSIIEAGREQQEEVARNAFFILAKLISSLKSFNYFLFAFLFPVVGGVMVLVGFLLLGIDPRNFPVQQNVIAYAIITVMSLSLLVKLLHTFILSSVIESIDNANLNISSQMLELTNQGLSVSGIGNEVVEIVSRLREICVLNDVLSIEKFQASGPVKSKRKFSRRAFAQDAWDTTAFHIVSRNSSGEYIGTLRINFSTDGNLPFTEALRSDILSENHISSTFSCEISKFFIKPSYRFSLTNPVAIELIYAAACLIELKSRSSSNGIIVYADIFDEKLPNTLSDRCYEKLGFKDTGIRYFDGRYSARSKVWSLTLTSNNSFSESIFFKRSTHLFQKVTQRRNKPL